MSDELLFRMQTLLAEAKKTVRLSDPIKDINLFSILGMENKEVSAHSAFLYYVLKPFVQKDGKVNDHHLRMFLKKLPLNIPEPDFVDIYREYPTDFGRLDFLILYGKNGKQDAVVIELKIWAGEQPKQIERYREYLKQKGYSTENVLFLTPDERKAETGNATNITLKGCVRDFLLSLSREYEESENPEKYADYTAIIKQYISIIKVLTRDDSFMAYGTELFKDAQDIMVADKLYDAEKNLLGSLIYGLMEGLRGMLVKDGRLDVPFDSPKAIFDPDCEQFSQKYISDYYEKGKKYPALCFVIEDLSTINPEYKLDLPKDTDLYFFVEIDWNMYAGCTLRQKKDNKLNTVPMPESTKKVLEEKQIQHNNTWLTYQYIQCDGMKTISFSDYQKGLLQLLDLSNSEGMSIDPMKIESIAEDIKRVFKEQCELFFDGIE